MSEIDDALRLHLLGTGSDEVLSAPGHQYISGFQACLIDARQASGRDQLSGAVIHEERTGHWLGAVGYMILLDQIGECFGKAAVEWPKLENSIENALACWVPDRVEEPDRCALYALRNALAHDYSLFNRNAGRPQYRHLFILDRHPTRLVQRRRRTWSGDFAERSSDCVTVISLLAFASVCEVVVERLLSAAEAGTVTIRLTGEAQELRFRYGMMIPDPAFRTRYPGAEGLVQGSLSWPGDGP